MEDFLDVEDRDGIRFTWNLWPSSTKQVQSLGIPIACMYTPAKENVVSTHLDPSFCSKCRATLNPYCQYNVDTQTWNCPFCYTVNKFAWSIDEGQAQSPRINELPPQVLSDATTIEYKSTKTPRTIAMPPVFFFILDITTRGKELEDLKSALLQVILNLPNNSLVGLLTYGKNAYLYDLEFQHCTKMHVFEGAKEVKRSDLYTFFDLQQNKDSNLSANVINSFLIAKSRAENHLVSLIQSLTTDPILNFANERPLRCSGTALSVAISTLICTMPTTGCRIMLFTSGPTTYGPGKVVDQNLKFQMRTHFEINKDETPYMHNATKFYASLGDLVKSNGYAVDIFSCSLNQTGVLEMIDLPRYTGGCIVMSETFSHPTFSNSLKKLFELDEEGYLKSHFYNCIQVQTSPEIVVSGSLGLLFPTKNTRSASAVSDNPIGIGRSCDYFCAVVEPTTTFTFFFEAKINENQIIPEDKLGLIQITTLYSHPNGRRIRRTTTVARRWLPKNYDKQVLLSGFDQEAATAVMARLILHKQIKEDFNIVKWVDNHLLQFCRKYCNYIVGNEESLTFPDSIAMYPNFFYYFRRGIFSHNFGCSPDESAMFKYFLNRENVINILLMIQPALDQYLINSSEPSPVFLSCLSLQDDCALLLDTFFTVIVWHGKTIVQWKNAGYHNLEEYQNLRDLLEAPRLDATAISNQRFPTPLFIECNAKTGPARYLEAVVDPAREGLINTEDSSLENFLAQLKRIIVKI